MAINFPSTSGQATDGSFTHTASGITWAWDGTTWKAEGVTSSYTLPTAAANTKGGVKIGSGLTMTGETLSASGSALTIQEEGSSLSTAATTLNFVGSSVTATGTGAVKTITITDSDSQLSAEQVQDIVGAMFSSNTETNITATYEDSDGTIDLVAQGGQPEITWTLGANGSTDYTFTGSGFSSATNDPTLTLIRGQTYKFDNQTGGHPFRIQSTVAQAGGGTAYNTGVTNNDATGGTATNVLTFVVPMDAPSTLYYQCTAHPGMTGTISILDQQSNLDSRSTFTGLTASLANNAAGNVSITAHKSYMLLKIKPSIAAWVTLYVDDASRTADASRVQGADPAPDAGVIAEVVTTSANQEIKMSPGVLGWHQDGGNDAVDTVFCKVVNKSGTTGTCIVSLTVVQLEA